MFCQHVESTSGSNTSPVLLPIIVSPSVTIFFWSSSQASLLTASSINFCSYTFSSMTCYLQSSSKHTIQLGPSAPKKIPLYFVIVSLMTFSSSSFVFIQFRQGIFNFFASSNRDVLFIYYQLCNPEAGYKSLFGLLFTPQKIHHHLNMLHCRFSASVYLHSSTYA